MKTALVVSSTRQGAEYLTQFLAETGCRDVTCAASGGEARRRLIEEDFDLCIINAPLPDENGLPLARDIMTEGYGQVVLIVKAEDYNEFSEKAEELGVFTLSKPINRTLFWNVLKLCAASSVRIKKMRRENSVLLQKIADIRIVDRAKCVLISHLGLTEAEAHKHIEKQAMDLRITRRSVAEDILKTYED